MIAIVMMSTDVVVFLSNSCDFLANSDSSVTQVALVILWVILCNKCWM